MQAQAMQEQLYPHLTSYLIGVAGSLTVAIFTAFVGWLLSRKFRDFLRRMVFRLLRVGIEFIYPDGDSAKTDMIRSIKQSEEIRILVIRGRSLADGYLDFLLREQPFRNVRVLLADPDTPRDYNPLVFRALELQKTEPKMTPDLYIDEGRQALRLLYGSNSNEQLVVKAYQLPAVFRIVATEKTMFLSFYPSVGRLRENTVLRIHRGSPFYDMFSKFFERVWSDSRSHEPTKYKENGR